MAQYTPHSEKYWKLKTERKAEYWLLGGKAIVDAGIADEVISTWSTAIGAGSKRVAPFFSETKDEEEEKDDE
jgi:hypothetical protein